MHRLCSVSRSRLWLALYGVCLIFVFAFILFEVLDVDGSDFQPLSATARGGLRQSTTEEPEQLARRALLPVAFLMWLAPAVMLGVLPSPACVVGRRISASPPAARRSSRHRVVLPRAALDVPASA